MNTRFFTGKGDGGTSEVGKQKIRKDDVLFDVLGGLDALNSWLGLCRVEAAKTIYKKELFDLESVIKNLQETLFTAQAEVASLGMGQVASKTITAAKVEFLEGMIGKIDGVLPSLKNFVIAGGTELSARFDVARTMARDLERAAVSFNGKKVLSAELLQFLNRLSSALFALARYVNFSLGIKEENPRY